MHNVSQTYMDILAGRYVVDMALMVADDRPAQICTDAQLMARNDPAHPENGPVYREDYISTMKTKANTFSGANQEIGAVTSREFALEFRNPAQTIPRAARLVPYERIRNGEQASEWIPKGEFFIDTRDTEPGYQDSRGNAVEFLSIYGNDALMKAEADYPASALSWPATDSDVVAEIAAFLGVQMAPETVAAINKGYKVPTYEDFCPREILSQIAIAYAGNFGLDDFGRLQFRPVNSAAARSAVNIRDNVDDFTFGEQLQPISRVELKAESGDTVFSAGSATGRTMTAETPWASDALAAAILAEVQGLTYQPMTAKGAVIDPAVELGDTMTVGSVTTRMYAQDLTFGEAASSDIQAPSDNDTDHEFRFQKRESRKMSRVTGGLGKRIDELDKDLVDTKAGLDTITDYDPETGYAIAEAALYATILDNTVKPARIKESRISTSVIRDANGNLKSLAQILADVIRLNGDTEILGRLSVEGQGGIRINNGNLLVPNGGINAINAFLRGLYVNSDGIYFGTDEQNVKYSGRTIRYIDEDSKLLVNGTALGTDTQITFSPGGATGRMFQDGGFYYWDLITESYQKVYVNGTHARTIYTGNSPGVLVVAPDNAPQQTITTRATMNYSQGHTTEGRFLMLDGTMAAQNFAFDMEE